MSKTKQKNNKISASGRNENDMSWAAEKFTLGCIKIRKYLQPRHINTLAIIFKRVLGGCVNSDRINAEVWLEAPRLTIMSDLIALQKENN